MDDAKDHSLTVQQLAERWQRRPQWVTMAARGGDIPGAWKLGHLWRFRHAEIEMYEQGQQVPNICELSPAGRPGDETGSDESARCSQTSPQQVIWVSPSGHFPRCADDADCGP